MDENLIQDPEFQKLNLVVPINVDKPPLLIWVGGGAWSFVDRNMEMDLAKKLAQEGIAVASVGHRLSKGTFSPKSKPTGITHPAHIKDLAEAFAWCHKNAGKYGYDPSNIFVGGYSSGAHLSALLAMDDEYLDGLGLSTNLIRGVIPIAGTYDIVDYYHVFFDHENPDTRKMAETHVKDVFGNDVSAFEEASPVTYLEDFDIPMLLISERGLYNYTKIFEEKIKTSDYQKVTIIHVSDYDHGGLWRNLSYDSNSFTRKAIIQWINSQSRTNDM